MSLALKLVLLPLLVAQAGVTRRRAPVLPEAAGERLGTVGAEPVTGGRARKAKPALRVLIVGDSSAAGVGVDTQDRALAGHLSRRLAESLAGPVRWQLLARSGITTREALTLLQDQAKGALTPVDVAVVVLGVNDVVMQVPSHRAVEHRAALADWLLARTGVRHVVFAPLPPMHQFPLLPQPLRWIAGTDARRHDAAMARWAATRDDVSHVPIALTLGRAVMASDGFHPGEPVYRTCGDGLAAAIAQLHAAGRLQTSPPQPPGRLIPNHHNNQETHP